ncbi:MAG: sulfatase-like hydrolase/transferase [Bacteroidaceae bacterium]|nr:sulfatase-like hydrolase/transferase [Bacteroidaceae bacterium]
MKLLLSLLGTLPLSVLAKTSFHNIIYIMCDDMGYGDLGCYGQRLIATPNIDRMAAEGMRFTDAYAGCPVSAPSRCSFMTGQHTGHAKIRGNREYWGRAVLRQNMFGENADYYVIGQEPYDMTQPIIPELFKAKGYRTGMFGKWAGGYWNFDYPDTYARLPDGNTDTSRSRESSSCSLPNLRGIDCFYGPVCQFQAHSYFPNFLNRYDPEGRGDTHLVAEVLEQNIKCKTLSNSPLKGEDWGGASYADRPQYSADLIHQYALEWLDRQTKDEPFLGIFTYTLPHAELWQPSDSIVERYHGVFPAEEERSYRTDAGSWYYGGNDKHAQFAAMITRLDAYVGEILAKLRDKGLADNTLVIFTSDNGPHEEGGADPGFFGRDGKLRGIKRSTYEGGIRIPFICWGAGIPRGTVSNHQLAFYDLMPTFMEYSGVFSKREIREHSQQTLSDSPSKGENQRSATEGKANSLPLREGWGGSFDGISFCPTLLGKPQKQRRHDFLYWEMSDGPTQVIGVRQGDWKLVVSQGTPFLYNLSTDIHEDHDLKDRFPDKLAELIGIVHREHIDSPLFPINLP